LALIRCLAKYLPSEDDKYREQGGMTEDIEGYDTSTDKNLNTTWQRTFQRPAVFMHLPNLVLRSYLTPGMKKRKKAGLL